MNLLTFCKIFNLIIINGVFNSFPFEMRFYQCVFIKHRIGVERNNMCEYKRKMKERTMYTLFWNVKIMKDEE